MFVNNLDLSSYKVCAIALLKIIEARCNKVVYMYSVILPIIKCTVICKILCVIK